ncbi:hypothetical protein CLV72_1011132 [Allonocardiopsis opalescens]|uniref:Uncharacterized protein n=1 Tax=Allonocardiopsis opalescens TaxID=1144618 RepID=A0A2T0QF68_9ACTN|nr:hypothetical protein CLV72_1011132 [Allonocardiopsis opalescens]
MPIPGTLRTARLEGNAGAARLTSSEDESARMEALSVVGERESALGDNWSYGITPPPAR